MSFQVGERVVVVSNNHFYGKVGMIVGHESPYTAKSCLYVVFPNYKGDVALFASNSLQRVSETYCQEHIKSEQETKSSDTSNTYTVEQFEKDIREAIEKIGKEGWRVDIISPQMTTLTGGSVKVGEMSIDLQRLK